MSRLPPNLVKAPSFDSPLRRTSAPELAVVAEPVAVEAAPVLAAAVAATPKAKPSRKRAKKLVAAGTEELYRTTLRIPQSVYLALENECHARRIAGDKIRIAELLREIATDWASKSARK